VSSSGARYILSLTQAKSHNPYFQPPINLKSTENYCPLSKAKSRHKATVYGSENLEVNTPQNPRNAFSRLAHLIRSAMEESGIKTPTDIQSAALDPILKGRNVLIVAPTGTGKTEAALLPIFSNLLSARDRKGISLLYVTPLRALNRDLMKRLTFWSAKLNLTCDVRHGDTSRAQRELQTRRPPTILVTTPETLQAILPARRMRQHLKNVQWVVVDEVHELAQDKRGAQLTVGLERLREITGKDFQRIGISATIGEPDKIGSFLAGSSRQIELVTAQAPKATEFRVEFPFPSEEDHDLAQTLFTTPEAAARINRMRELADNHTSTLIFVNSRQNAEMLGLRLGMIDKATAVHHGSLSREERVRIENEFKEGKLKAIVCTSTLELGIDIGTVDLVLQYLSPRQVSTLIQRVGRSGHKVEATPKGTIISAHSDDLLESVATIERAQQGRLEALRVHEKALDVLAHQVAGLVMDRETVSADSAFSIIRRAYPYRSLSQEAYRQVIDYLTDLRLLKEEKGILTKSSRTRLYYYENLSMIPDEKRYPIVDITTQRNVGVLGEEFMTLRARVGLHFICRGRVWEIMKISEDGRVYVLPIEDPTAAIPGWDGEILPVPFEIAQEVGELRRQIADALTTQDPESVIDQLAEKYEIERYGARRAVEELNELVREGISVPDNNRILVEFFDRYMIVHACFGEAVNRTLSYIFESILSEKRILRNVWADGYRILIELAVEMEGDEIEGLASSIIRISPQEAEMAFRRYVEARRPFSYYMKFIAERFGAIPRGITIAEEGRLEDMVTRFRNTPIYEETLREALQEKVDIETTRLIFSKIALGKIDLYTTVMQKNPTPLAYHILNKFSETPEMAAPESIRKQNIERMKAALQSEYARLMCMTCGKEQSQVRVQALTDQLKCLDCGSGLLAVLNKHRIASLSVTKKWLRDQPLTEEEQKILSRTRRTADLVLSYGKRGVMALLTWGVGPQTAAQVLARMHRREEDFFADLLQAKLKYIQTRPFWD